MYCGVTFKAIACHASRLYLEHGFFGQRLRSRLVGLPRDYAGREASDSGLCMHKIRQHTKEGLMAVPSPLSWAHTQPASRAAQQDRAELVSTC